MLGCEPTHVAAEDAVHYDRKPIRADQRSSKGDKVRTDAVPLRFPAAAGGCQRLRARARARHSPAIDEPSQ